MIEEVWKPIKNYEGLYEVSNLGQIKSFVKDKYLLPDKSSRYYRVSLYKNKTYKRKSVHRIVAETFIKKPDDESKNTVNHIDGDKTNNRADNLEWLSLKENNDHAIANGLNNQAGENNKNCKFGNQVILEMRSKYKTRLYTKVQISKMFGVSYIQTKRILRGNARRDILNATE